MSDELFRYDGRTPDHFEEPLTNHDRTRAAEIARELLSLPGWTGAQIERLEAAEAGRDDDPDLLQYMEEMKAAREREDALKNPPSGR